MSAIDALLPVTDNPTTASVRANFARAKLALEEQGAEIRAIRERIAALEQRLAAIENRQLRLVNGR